MSLSDSIFQKKLNDLTIEDLEEFFREEKEETSFLEFKTGEVEVEGIYKEVCAFLNTDGGILIFGAPREKEVDKKRICVGGLVPTKKIKSELSLGHLISANISPSPGRLNIKHVKYKDGFVFIIEVFKSSHPPHQVSNDGKYYIRMDKEAKPAPHGIVEALFKKITYPRLEGYIKINNIRWHGNDFNSKKILLEFSLFVFNKSKFQNEYDLNCRLLIDEGNFSGYQYHIGKDKYYHNGKEMIYAPAKSILFFGEPFVHNEAIDVSLDIINPTLQLRIFFFFGGKTSPLMVSEYIVSLQSIPLETDNYNSMFQLINENQYLHDKSDTISLNEKEKLDLILGR